MKHTYDPLLAPGRHFLGLAEIEDVCVRKFSNSSSRREYLFRELARLHDALRSTGVTCELWTNGSFLSEKLEPGDIDVVICIDRDVLDGLEGPNRWLFNILDARDRFSPDLETFIMPSVPLGHEDYDKHYMHYWGNMWGSGYDDSLKGYVVTKIGETDVGLRLTAL